MTLIEYLSLRKRAFGIFALFCAVFLAAFFLYRLPWKAVAYPAVLCASIGIVICAVDYSRLSRKRRSLAQAADAEHVAPENLPNPENVIEEDYHRVIARVQEEQRVSENAMHTRCEDLSDYYTAWAHQIKTPIASMRLQLQNEDSQLSRSLKSELLRVEQYVDMALIYLKLDSHSADYVIRAHDLDGIVRKSVRRFSGDFIQRRLRLDYAPLNRTVVTDEKWLGFVLEQILSNALKYTREGAVSIYMEGDDLCVRDTGIGIAAEDLPRIFERGYTGINGRSDARASGIGLYLCREICSRLGHGISAESVVGAGTVIRLRLAQPDQRLE